SGSDRRVAAQPRKRQHSWPPCAGSPASSASTSSKSKATTWSTPSGASPRNAAPPTSSSAPSSHAWCASCPGSTSALSPTAPTVATEQDRPTRDRPRRSTRSPRGRPRSGIAPSQPPTKGVAGPADGAPHPRPLHRRQPRPNGAQRCHPHRPRRGRRARARLPADRPARVLRRLTAAQPGRCRDAAARSGGERRPALRRPRRRPHRKRPITNTRPPPAVGSRTVRPRHRIRPDRIRQRQRARRLHPQRPHLDPHQRAQRNPRTQARASRRRRARADAARRPPTSPLAGARPDMITAAPPDDAFEQEVERLVELLPRPNPVHGYRQILLAYDGSDGAKAALDRVAAVATSQSTVTVIAVIPFESVGASTDPIKPELRDWQWNALTEATALLARRGIRAFIEAAAGNPTLVVAAPGDLKAA